MRPLPKVISLFSGSGGLDWGFKEAGFRISIAFDISPAAIETHRRNFPDGQAVVADLTQIKPSGVVGHVRSVISAGEEIGVIGGPPCQGFSRANTTSLAADPRNRMPALYVRVVKALQAVYQVKFLVVENVLGIRDRKHQPTYKRMISGLKKLGFDVSEDELCSADFGVAQLRRRVMVIGLPKGCGPIASLADSKTRKNSSTVRDAISGLAEPVYYQRSGLSPNSFPEHPNHWTMQPKSARFALPGQARSDGRSFKQLRWDAPSPTIAFGHREIHVHPEGHRRLSIYEALLLQGFPREFVLVGNLSEQVEQVSNAVPPPMAESVAKAVKTAILNAPLERQRIISESTTGQNRNRRAPRD
ncbi:MAG: DNA cytosine methyltransferase [Nannocystis sp.]|nr:DNA cytosine methyltransferase [Nannocystis sp.]